jgi:nicotinamide phosphoribosyltransferase
MNIIKAIDGYKLDHRRQYPPGTTSVLANWTPRESRVPAIRHVVFFGLQYVLLRFFQEEFAKFFAAPLATVLRSYARRVNGYLGPNSVGTAHIEALHALGYLPLEVRALPEGTRVPLRVPMFTIENTLPEFFWLVNYLETLISCEIWQPCTSATLAFRLRQRLDAAAALTGSPLDFVQWQGHDFSMRGMGGVASAAASGAGHLLSFTGSDTLPAIDWIEEYYGPTADDCLLAASVAATEHSVMCAGGELGELETFERILDLYPTGIVSVVSDTWNLWRVLTEHLPKLRERILARDGKLVIRPDTGNPADILCGDPAAEHGSPAHRGVISLLWDVFGGSKTKTCHRLLDQHIGAIYGDAITLERADEVCARLDAKAFASGNVVFGVGSYTYQYVTRDTFGFALKSTHCVVNGESRSIFKAPVTGNGMKNSARGRLAVFEDIGGELALMNDATAEQEKASLLRPVWRDGSFIRRENFATIRNRLAGYR